MPESGKRCARTGQAVCQDGANRVSEESEGKGSPMPPIGARGLRLPMRQTVCQDGANGVPGRGKPHIGGTGGEGLSMPESGNPCARTGQADC